MEQMKGDVEGIGRKLVIITDPHIKVDKEYFVWSEGTDLDGTYNPDGTINSIFVKSLSM